MAHFLTIVVGENPEDLLRPYWDGWEYDNPKGKYDWYDLGGRFDGHFILKSGMKVNQTYKQLVDWYKTECSYAILDIDGKWYENEGKIEKRWDKFWWNFMKTLPDKILLSAFDCHS